MTIIFSCSEEAAPGRSEESNSHEDVQERAYEIEELVNENYEISQDEALLVAENFFRYDADFNKRDYKEKKVSKITTEIDSLDGLALFYTIEYSKGFCIVSADSRFEPILAQTEYHDWGGVDLEGPNILLEIYKNRIRDIRTRREERPRFIEAIWEKLSNYEKLKDREGEVVHKRNSCTYGECRPPSCNNTYSYTVGPFVDPIAQWSQIGHFNFFSGNNSGCNCNRNTAGCGPVALGMVLRYHESPLITMTYNGISTFTNYSSMPLNRGACAENSGGFLSSSMLLRLCGDAMGTIFGISGCSTATIPADIGDGLDFYGYTHDGIGTLSSRYSAITNDLQSQFPVIFTGATNSFGADWHIWLADGYKQFHYEYWSSNGNCNGDPYYGSHPYYCGVCPDCINCTIYAANQWHMNWGWNGTSNAWYAASPYSIGDYDSLMKVYTNFRP
ncbi:MAG: C10 family peptidase [Saprospiraceae bacterium]|nr:C10 family peptidase [Saprospiraceae bacterium]